MDQVVHEFAGMDLVLVQTKDQFTEMLAEVSRHEVIAFDIEDNGVGVHAADYTIAGFSLAVSAYRGWYVPINHTIPRTPLFYVPPKQLDEKWTIDAVRELLETHKLIGHNIKYDYQGMRRVGVKINIYFDTMIASWVLDERKRRHGLKALVKSELGKEVIELKEIIGDSSYNFCKVPVEDTPRYAAADACNTYAFFQRYLPKLEADARAANIFWGIEMPCVEVTAEMETTGIVLDKPVIEKLHHLLSQKTLEAEEVLRDMMYKFNTEWVEQEGEFRPSKDDHITQLWACVGLDGKRKKDDGEELDSSAIEKMLDRKLSKQQTEFLKCLLDFRKVSKLDSTYTLPLLDKVIPRTGRLHPSFLQNGTKSGRYSSRDPNGQNLPRDVGDYDIRAAFTCGPGKVLVLVDYDAMEIRITAALSNCPVLKPIVLGTLLFNEGTGELKQFTEEEAPAARKDGWIKVDMHKYTATSAFGVKYSEVTKDQRQKAKPVNFGIIYGITKYGLSAQLNITPDAAQKLIDGFFDAYPGVHVWITETRTSMRLKGFTETAFGRRRRVPVDLWEEKSFRPTEHELDHAGVLREGGNHTVQGSGADIVKLAMRKIYDRLVIEQLDARMVAQIHDEIIIETTPQLAHYIGKLMSDEMFFTLRGVPLPAEPEYKITWSKEDQDLSHLGLVA